MEDELIEFMDLRFIFKMSMLMLYAWQNCCKDKKQCLGKRKIFCKL